MAKVLAVLASARSGGWTSQLLDRAIVGLESVGVEVEKVNLHRYKFGPCTGCFNCIRSEEHLCTKKDDMTVGGALYEKLIQANGIIIADPVYLWGPSSITHVFVERMYPFIWGAQLYGMPFGSISCASNTGFHYQATQNIAKLVFNIGFKYIGSVPAHTSYFEESLKKSEALGKAIGLKAIEDAKGRVPLTIVEKFKNYREPWDVTRAYFKNLSNGSLKYEDSMPHLALKNNTFTREEAIELLKNADERLKKAFAAMERGDYDESVEELCAGSASWADATWKEFLEEKVIGVGKPAAYYATDD